MDLLGIYLFEGEAESFAVSFAQSNCRRLFEVKHEVGHAVEHERLPAVLALFRSGLAPNPGFGLALVLRLCTLANPWRSSLA